MIKVGGDYQHAYYKEYTCKVVELTAKGAKVLFTDSSKRKPKTTTQYYDKWMFGEGGQWKLTQQ